MPSVNDIISLDILPAGRGRLGEGGRRLCRRNNGAGRQKPLLSVVTVTLNSGSRLQKTMQSVLQWPDDQVEYIIIDGGSTDETLRILEAFNSRLEYWVSEPDTGISNAFNKGLSLCRGEIIGLLNAGDWFERETLQAVLSGFAENPEAGVLCGRLQFWHEREKAYCTDALPKLLPRDMSVAHPACFVRRSIYLRNGGFDPEYRLAMDYELLLRYFVNGVHFVRTRSILTNMQHDGVSELNWKEALHETHKARQRYMPSSVYAGRRYLQYLIVRRYIRYALQSLGLHALVRFYREHIAAVEKVRM